VAGGHVHALYRHGTGLLYRLRPQTKIAAAFLFVFAVVATPREAFWAFAVYAAFLIGLVVSARLGLRFVAARMSLEIPFVVAALLFPLLSGGEHVDVLGIALSRNGLWDMWNILAKATLGLLTSIVLAGTTEIRRMRVAMQSRAYNPTWIGQARPYAVSTGTIFVRSYERGERVYLAMAARGYAGHMPRIEQAAAPAAQWLAVLTVPAVAWLVAGIAWWTA
jgi:cobalt/nickel transport system permease protein